MTIDTINRFLAHNSIKINKYLIDCLALLCFTGNDTIT